MANFYTFLNLNQNEIRNFVLQNLPSDPNNGAEGQTYWNTTDKKIRFFNGTEWEDLLGGAITGIAVNAPLEVTDNGDGTVTINLPEASTAEDGYMPKEDKEKLDGATSNNVVSTLVLRDSNGDFAARFISLQTPQNSDHAATKGYVDALLQGFQAPSEVKVVATQDVQRIGGILGTDEIDGVNLSTGDRILLTAQNDPVENGVYTYSNVGWSRGEGWESGTEVSANLVIVKEGGQFSDTFWLCTNNDNADTVGTDGLQFSQFSGANEIIAGDGLSKSGNTLSVNVDDQTIETDGDALRVKNEGVTKEKINPNVAGESLEKNSNTGALDVKVDGQSITRNGNGELQANFSGAGVYNSTSQISLTSTPTQVDHNLNNNYPSVICHAFNGSNWEPVNVLVEAINNNSIQLTANPSVSVRVTVIG